MWRNNAFYILSNSLGDNDGRNLEINNLLPCAAVLSGIKVAHMVNFLSLMSVDCQTEQYMKGELIPVYR